MILKGLAAIIATSTAIQFDFVPVPVPEETARWCSAIVGVPYGTDNITDGEWRRFQRCVKQRTT